MEPHVGISVLRNGDRRPSLCKYPVKSCEVSARRQLSAPGSGLSKSWCFELRPPLFFELRIMLLFKLPSLCIL